MIVRKEESTKTGDSDLCEDEIIHIEIWKKHRDTISFISITEVKLQKL